MGRDTVAFQGVQGAYSEQAIRQHFGDSVNVHPCHTLGDLFDAIQQNTVTYGILPVENALAGAVNQAYELLMDYDLRIQAEVILHVHHALLAPRGTGIADIKYVRSHPQALAQCERFLKRNNLEGIPAYDTAGAARNLADTPDAHTGAIASELAAQLYDLDVLETEIEDVQFNFTRFLCWGMMTPHVETIIRHPWYSPRAIALRHYMNAWGEFASRDLNLTKIESRPRRNRPWEPVFYLDFEGHWQDPLCQEALAQLVHRASFVKMLGSYPAVQTKSVGI